MTAANHDSDDSREHPSSIPVWLLFALLHAKHVDAHALPLGRYNFADLHTFVLKESQPIVLRLPQNLGPDFQKRMMVAFRSKMPKLFVFAKAPETASDEVVDAAKAIRSKTPCLIFFYAVTPGDEEDEGAYHMQQIGLDTSLVNQGPVAAISYGLCPQYTPHACIGAELLCEKYLSGFVHSSLQMLARSVWSGMERAQQGLLTLSQNISEIRLPMSRRLGLRRQRVPWVGKRRLRRPRARRSPISEQ